MKTYETQIDKTVTVIHASHQKINQRAYLQTSIELDGIRAGIDVSRRDFKDYRAIKANELVLSLYYAITLKYALV